MNAHEREQKVGGILIFGSFFLCSQTCGTARRRHLRLHGGSHNSARHNRFASVGSGRRSRLLLADGLPSTTQNISATTTSARVPESAIRESRSCARTYTRLSIISNDKRVNTSMQIVYSLVKKLNK